MEESMAMKQKKYSKLLKTWRVVKLTTLNWCTGQVIMSILTLLGLDPYLVTAIYLKLINGSIGINVEKLKLKEFKNKIDSLKRKKAKKQPYKINKKDALENTGALYNGLNIIVDAFKNRIIENKYRPEIDVDIFDPTPDSNIYESHGLTKKEMQMFIKVFAYKNPVEFR